MKDLTIVIPSLNEDHEILRSTKKKLQKMGAQVLIVEDGSDNPLPGSIKHGFRYGYGSALMTGIKNSTRDLILTMDGDGQHSVDQAVKLYKAFKLMTDVDMLIGMRRIKKESLIRFLGRKFLNWTASIYCTYWLNDLNSGCRIFKREVAIGYFPILCRQFSFTTSLTISFMCDGHRVEFFPINIQPRAIGKSRVNVIIDGFRTLYYIFWIGTAMRTRWIRKLLRKVPLYNFITGKGWGAIP